MRRGQRHPRLVRKAQHRLESRDSRNEADRDRPGLARSRAAGLPSRLANWERYTDSEPRLANWERQARAAYLLTRSRSARRVRTPRPVEGGGILPASASGWS